MKLKYFLSILVIAAVLFSLVGCGSSMQSQGKAPVDPADVQEKSVRGPEKKEISITYLDKDWKQIGEYSEGLCPVLDGSNGLWGYVDKTGRDIIQPQYYDAKPFYEGLAAVKNAKGYYEFIDKAGKTVINGEYTAVIARFKTFAGGSAHADVGFSGGYACVVQDKKTVVIDKNGKIIKAFAGYEDTAQSYTNSDDLLYRSFDTGIYDTLYNKIRDVGWNTQAENNYSTKYILIVDEKGVHVQDSAGTVVLDQSQIPADNAARYTYKISDSYVIVERNLNSVISSAIYDYTGALLVDYQYKQLFPVRDQVFIAVNNAGKQGIIDPQGKVIVPIESDNIYNPEQYNNKVVNGASPRYFDAQTGEARLVIRAKDSDGMTKHQYYDFQTGTLADEVTLPTASFYYDYTSNGVYYALENQSIKVYNGNGNQVGTVEYPFYSEVTALMPPQVSDKSAFLRDNIIPCVNQAKTGITFAVISP